MQFYSFSFLFYFLPLMLAIYYIVPRRFRPLPLALGSLLFYWSASGYRLWSLLLLLALTTQSYLNGLLLERFRRRWFLLVAMSLPVATLIFLKYYAGGSALPAGLSFYVFQILAYLIDVYRENLPAERKWFSYSAQTAMFPKLLSGPLTEPAALQKQMQSPAGSAEAFHTGLRELILGLGLKVLLADRLGGLWNRAGVVGYESISTPFAWLALIAFALRLYLDFWGYSCMAVGLGRMLGFQLPENFHEPYSAWSVSEFYRRWHITLGAWFREYIYIPLGGNRKGVIRTVCNLAIVWLLTGLWHGTGMGYLIWAGFLFLLIANERLWLRKLLERVKILGHIYTVFAILLSWVPFAIGDLTQMQVFLGKLFGVDANLGVRDYLSWGRQYAGLLLVGILFATPLPRYLWEKLRKSFWADIALFLLFWAAVYYIATAAQDPFMYSWY